MCYLSLCNAVDDGLERFMRVTLEDSFHTAGSGGNGLPHCHVQVVVVFLGCEVLKHRIKEKTKPLLKCAVLLSNKVQNCVKLTYNDVKPRVQRHHLPWREARESKYRVRCQLMYCELLYRVEKRKSSAEITKYQCNVTLLTDHRQSRHSSLYKNSQSVIHSSKLLDCRDLFEGADSHFSDLLLKKPGLGNHRPLWEGEKSKQ